MAGFFKKLLGLDKLEFEKIEVSAEVIDAIIELAKQTYPKEFIAFLEGKVKNKSLRITGLLYQEYVASEDTAISTINFPLSTKVVGSVHSHPGYSNSPSKADLHFFTKHGLVHMIIKVPYCLDSIQAYSTLGDRIRFSIAEKLL